MDFEDRYFDFDIAFQNLLESYSLMDTLTLDAVKPNFSTQTIKFNWREMHKVYTLDNENLPEYILAMIKNVADPQLEIANDKEKDVLIEQLRTIMDNILMGKEV